MKICLYDHHNYSIPTDGIGGVIGLFQILYQGLKNEGVDLTLIINDNSPLESEPNFNVIKLPFNKIEELRWGKLKVSDYFNDGIFYTNSSGRHVQFDFTDFRGKWISTCHGCWEYVGNSECQVFVSNNQLKQHFKDGLFDSFSNDYRVIHGSIDGNDYFWQEGTHDKFVWMGRIDGAKAERLYDIALLSDEKIYCGGWYSSENEWLFNKIMSTNKVEWLGEIKGTVDKRKFYSMAKASIHCSTFEDPCPTTVLEAQACGIPVISYSNGSLLEICYNKNYIFDTIDKLIECMKTEDFGPQLNNPKLKSFIEKNFLSENYHKKYLEIFKQLWEK